MAIEKKISLDELAGLTEGLTGADIKNVCMEAGIFALRENKKKIELRHFNDAVQKVSRLPVVDRPNDRMFA